MSIADAHLFMASKSSTNRPQNVLDDNSKTGDSNTIDKSDFPHF
jgi:hypothetical protein